MKIIEKISDYRATAVCAVLTVPAIAFAQSATPEQSIESAKTSVIALLGTAGAALVAVALAGVGWAVGVKLIKRFKSAA